MCGRKIAAKVRFFLLQKSFIKIFLNILPAAGDKIIRGSGIAGCLLPETA
jgi:hypothetical protein